MWKIIIDSLRRGEAGQRQIFSLCVFMRTRGVAKPLRHALSKSKWCLCFMKGALWFGATGESFPGRKKVWDMTREQKSRLNWLRGRWSLQIKVKHTFLCRHRWTHHESQVISVASEWNAGINCMCMAGSDKRSGSICFSGSKVMADPLSLRYQGVGLSGYAHSRHFPCRSAVNSSSGVYIANSWRMAGWRGKGALFVV